MKKEKELPNINHVYTKYYRCGNGSKLFKHVLDSNGLTQTYADDWGVLIPCNTQYGDKFFSQIVTDKPEQIVSYVSGNIVLGSKLYIWHNLVKTFGRDTASQIMPRSYIFPQDNDIFISEYMNNKYYMLKNEQQRQKGLKLSNNFNEIINSHKQKYKIVQEFIDKPFTYKTKKVNFRIYLLITCDNDKKESYVYDDGIISYSKKSYNDINFDTSVASFYTSKKMYDSGEPILLSELIIQRQNVDWNKIKQQFNDKITMLLKAAYPKLCNIKLNNNNRTFQLFGIDFLVYTDDNKQTDTRILEVNIGPGMDSYCSRDNVMRTKLFNDVLQIVGINKNNEKNNFTKIHVL
jgi:hypothetical protein